MAWSVNGIGTHHYGRKPHPDGGFVTTEWVVFAFVPIFPLKSFHVMSESHGFMSREMKGFRVPLNREAVVRVYVWELAVVALLAAAGCMLSS